ncbi:MAG: hypothetical protein DMF62_04605 [Acidobacteria bacterium]|nr:MAG: hypothetical protein DMF62_04605 [Acidobacteriota bacterium]
MPSETDYAWLAGFIDGEGCFRWAKGGRGVGSIRLTVGQKHREVLDKIARIAECGHVNGPYISGNKYMWSISAAQLRNLMPKIWPYLGIVKKRQYNNATLDLRVARDRRLERWPRWSAGTSSG